MAAQATAAAMVTLAESYRVCERIARTRARNFYYAFLPLPRGKRRAMCAVYAFLRYCDDLADDPSGGDRAAGLRSWRAALKEPVAGAPPVHDMMPAFHDTVERFSIPLQYFEDVIDGAEMDLHIRRYATFEDLYRYCYRVASAVGIICLSVFEYEGAEAVELAEACGIAFQITNIIRDVREDADTDRIYLPQEDLDRFNCPESDLRRAELSDPLKRVLEFEAARAQEYYQRSIPLIGLAHTDSRPCLSAMICIYHHLLRDIGLRCYDVLNKRVSLSTCRKLLISARCWRSPEASLRQEVLGGRC